MRRIVLAWGAALALTGCAQYAELKPRHAVLEGPPGREPLGSAEKEIERARRREHAEPLRALGECVEALDVASRELRADPQNLIARRDYNFALSRIFQIAKKEKVDAWSKPVTVTGEHGTYELATKPDPRPEWNPALYDFTPADQFDVRGRYVTERTTRDGIGAPIVAVERQANAKARESFAPERLFYSVTAIGRFEGRRCILSAEDPLATERVTLLGHSYSLAADFTVPL